MTRVGVSTGGRGKLTAERFRRKRPRKSNKNDWNGGPNGE
jgi:hypothetical protein